MCLPQARWDIFHFGIKDSNNFIFKRSLRRVREVVSKLSFTLILNRCGIYWTTNSLINVFIPLYLLPKECRFIFRTTFLLSYMIVHGVNVSTLYLSLSFISFLIFIFYMDYPFLKTSLLLYFSNYLQILINMILSVIID